MTSMTSCIMGKNIRVIGPDPLELFFFVVLAILMAMAGGISEHMLTSWSSLYCSLETQTYILSYEIVLYYISFPAREN